MKKLIPTTKDLGIIIFGTVAALVASLPIILAYADFIPSEYFI